MTMDNSIIDQDTVDASADSPLDDSLLGHDQDQSGLEPAPPPKRKGGRKPIYATSEERKQRNRQAQAAFRERRTEYIKQMEVTMKDNDEVLENLRQEHRELTDQCHMLRYKTSLLEELLDERGIDFRSELQARSNRSMLGQTRPQQLASPNPRIDHAPQVKRRSVNNGVAPRSDRPLKGAGGVPGMASAVRHPLDSPQSSVHSPSSFTFPNLSSDVQDFDSVHNGADPMHRTVGNDIYEAATHRPHLSSSLARAQHNMLPQHNPYAQQPNYGHDDSYDYNQEPLRPSQSRLNSNRLGK